MSRTFLLYPYKGYKARLLVPMDTTTFRPFSLLLFVFYSFYYLICTLVWHQSKGFWGIQELSFYNTLPNMVFSCGCENGNILECLAELYKQHSLACMGIVIPKSDWDRWVGLGTCWVENWACVNNVLFASLAPKRAQICNLSSPSFQLYITLLH